MKPGPLRCMSWPSPWPTPSSTWKRWSRPACRWTGSLPRLSFFFACGSDFFEEAARFRAVRRVFATIMRERFGAANPASMRLRFHCQTAAATLTRPQYKVNIVRTALQALAAVLGGAQSLHTNGMDEAFSIPTEEAMKIALRTQQVIAEESNVANVVDPLGGSYYVEKLTDQYVQAIQAILKEVDERGGTVKLIEEGWFQRKIAEDAYETALRKQSGKSRSSESTATWRKRKRWTWRCIPTIPGRPIARSTGPVRSGPIGTRPGLANCCSD